MEMLSLGGANSTVMKALFTPDGTRILALTAKGKLLAYDSRPYGRKVRIAAERGVH